MEVTGSWKKIIISFFPYENASYGRMLCYVHNGQHNEADYGYYLECKKASEEEYKNLFNELENLVGYNLKIVNRINYDRYITKEVTPC
jgi:hypothetical protein